MKGVGHGTRPRPPPARGVGTWKSTPFLNSALGHLKKIARRRRKKTLGCNSCVKSG